MKNKLFLIGFAVALGLWAAYFVNVAGFRDFVDDYQEQYNPSGEHLNPIVGIGLHW